MSYDVSNLVKLFLATHSLHLFSFKLFVQISNSVNVGVPANIQFEVFTSHWCRRCRVVETFEIYNITDSEHDGLYVREKDKMEFAMSVLKLINKVTDECNIAIT